MFRKSLLCILMLVGVGLIQAPRAAEAAGALFMPNIEANVGSTVIVKIRATATEAKGFDLAFVIDTTVITPAEDFIRSHRFQGISLVSPEWSRAENTILISLGSQTPVNLALGVLVELAFDVNPDVQTGMTTSLTWLPYNQTQIDEAPAILNSGGILVLPAGQSRPMVNYLDAAVLHLTVNTTSYFIPMVKAKVSDINGLGTLTQIVLSVPGGEPVPLLPSPDGMYDLVLPAMPSYTGGEFSLFVMDDTGLESPVVVDVVAAPQMATPTLLYPAVSAADIPLAPILDWNDLPGAAQYILHMSTANPLTSLEGFLDPENAVLDFRNSAVSVSEYRVPEGRLHPDTGYFWVVGAADRIVDTDEISVSMVSVFTTKSTAVVVDDKAPVLESNVALNDRTDQTISLAWRTNEASDTRVYYGLAEDAITDTVVVNESVRLHAITINGLEPETTYYIEVASRDFAGNELKVPLPIGVQTFKTSDISPPEFTAGPTALKVDQNRVIIGWSNDEPTEGRVELSGAGLDTIIYTAGWLSDHAISVLGLTAATVYTYDVYVTDRAGNGPSVRMGLTFTTAKAPDTIPPRVIKRPVAVPGQNEVLIRWEADEQHSAVTVIREPGAPGQEGLLVTTIFGEERAREQVVRVTGLTPSTNYQFRVRLKDGDGNETFTRPFTFRTLAVPDTDPPTILRYPLIAYVADRLAVLYWVTDEPSDSYVEVYADGSLVSTVGRGQLVKKHRVVITRLVRNTRYDFVVISTDAAGNAVTFPPPEPSKLAKTAGGRASSSFSTAPQEDTQPPVLVTLPVVAAKTATALTITWQTDETANSTVYFGEGAAGKLSRLGETTLDQTVALTDYVTEHTVTVTGLSPETIYAYKIGSSDPTGTTGETLSDISEAATLADEDLAAPVITEGPAIASKTDTRITVVWTTNEPSDSRVQYRPATGGDFQEITSPDLVTSHAMTITNLTASKMYQIIMYSTDLAGNGPTSEAIFGTTESAADLTEPVITAGPTVRTEAERAWVSWTTDEPANSAVQFGESLSYGRISSNEDLGIDHEVVLTNLIASTTYYYALTTADASGNQTDSSGTAVKFTTAATADLTPPAKVAGLSAAIGASEARLSWTANTELDLGAYILQRAAGGDYATIATLGEVTSYTDPGLTAGTAYTYKVFAQDRSVNLNIGDASDVTSVTPLAVYAPSMPLPPPVPLPNDVSAQPILPVGNAHPGIRPVATYSYIVALDEGLSNVVATASGVEEAYGATTWQVDFRLEHGLTYYWSAKALDTEGFSGRLAPTKSFVVDTAIAVSVQLSSFTASAEKRYVALNWSLTQTSDPAAFNVWRATADGEFTRVTSSPVTAPTLEFAWIDIAVTPGITYQYKIQALDTRGNSTMFGPVSVTVALPRMLSIDQNIPNPFNPTTSIGYQVPWSADVRLVIHNILGQEVVTLVDAPRSSGFYRVTWHGRTGVGTEAGSGVYFARLVATPTDGARSESRIIRMMLVK